jgi:hypothetical protein
MGANIFVVMKAHLHYPNFLYERVEPQIKKKENHIFTILTPSQAMF